MNFFKAVFSDDPPSPSDEQGSGEHDHNESDPNSAPIQSPDPNTAWSFGGLIKTLASKSESVIDTYRRDLEEFGSGLRKETSVIREAASRAVKDLPASLDVGASVAQESLESVGQAIDDIGSSVWKSTAQIISQGRDTLLAADFDSDPSDNSNNSNSNSIIVKQQLSSSSQSSDLKPYSRFDALVHALQSDVNTYLEEPADLESYNEWNIGFELDKKGEEIEKLMEENEVIEEIEKLMEENEVIEEIYGKVVPSRTDHESFWSRYFYKLHKLKQAEDARAKLVKRVISGNEEEDLTWDFDDDENGNNGYEPKGNSSGVTELKEGISDEVATGGAITEDVRSGKEEFKLGNDVKGVAHESETDGGDKSEVKYDDNVVSNSPETVSESRGKLDLRYDGKATSEAKADNGESCKDSDISVVSSQPSMPEEEDLGWDEIEDIGSSDENKGDAIGITSRIDLQKRLSAAEHEEDLTWDTEDDDEAVKS